MFDIVWDDAIVVIFFIYGLAFYSMGLALWIESGRASELGFARSMRLLAAFGLLHGLHEWMDMIEQGSKQFFETSLPDWWLWPRLVLLSISFVALLAFGEQLLDRERYGRASSWFRTWGAIALFAIAAVGVQVSYDLDDMAWARAIEVLARYTMGIPGIILTCLALWQQRETFQQRGMRQFVYDLTQAIAALLVYGLIGQVFNGESVFFPSNVLNGEAFQEQTGFPIQLFRAWTAILIAFSMIRVLRSLEVENEQRLLRVEQAKLEAERRSHAELERLNTELQAANAETARLLDEVRQRDALRGELLQRITLAQEGERQRIARELHDGTGQALTGLALGLRGIVNLLRADDCGSITDYASQLSELEQMATTSLGELRHLINDLRPPQLDDMGLVAALRWQVDNFNRRGTIKAEFNVSGKPYPLPPEVETTLFRIAQEGLTNIAKHARASHAWITLDFNGGVRLSVRDNGVGFDPSAVMDSAGPRAAWGLLGMQERANLINAHLSLDSAPGAGATLTVELDEPVSKESDDADSRRDR